MALSNKQKAFIERYLIHWNATKAAIEAGYSERTARSIGSENLTKPDISAEIEARKAELMMSADEVLTRLTEQARAEQTNYLDVNGELRVKALLDAGKGHLIKGVKETKYGKVYEFHDAQTALLNIGKTYALFTDKVEHSGEVTHNVKGYKTVSPDDWEPAE